MILRKEQFYPAYERRLLDQYLELKGNIRVFVRVRPILSNDFKAYDGSKESFAIIEKQLRIPNSQQIELESTVGGNMQKHHFNFDMVFGQQ
jgi:hypothetical protein